MNNRKSHKWIIMAFVLLLFGIATMGVYQSRETEIFVEKQIPSGNLDSIISAKIDDRFRSYDYYFIYDNSVVVDSLEKVIGKVVLYTNKEEVEKYYANDSAKIKTDLYRSLVEGRLRILEKKANIKN
jgi:hypothetical protein